MAAGKNQGGNLNASKGTGGVHAKHGARPTPRCDMPVPSREFMATPHDQRDDAIPTSRTTP